MSTTPESLDREGRSELHHAVSDRDELRVRRLLSAGLDPNRADRGGYAPLHFAALEGAVEIARALLQAGARVDPQEEYGNTPLWLAVMHARGDGTMIKLLRAFGADPWIRNHHSASPVELARRIANYDLAQFFRDQPESPPAV